MSHPVRDAWIENLKRLLTSADTALSHPVRDAWIENKLILISLPGRALSHPVRDAWIENATLSPREPSQIVASREGCVD